MRRMMAVLMLVALAIGAASLGVRSASAHEHRTVLDRYQFIVGFVNEPAVSGELNSVDLRVSDMSMATPAADGGEATGAPVEGLESTLTVDIIYGDQTKNLPLEARWGTPGAYNGWVIPVAAGDYSFHIYGTINGEAIDETFTPGPETFSSVEDRAELEFPAAESSPAASAPIAFGSVDSGSTGGPGTGGILLGVAALGILGAAGVSLMRRKVSAQPAPVLSGAAGD